MKIVFINPTVDGESMTQHIGLTCVMSYILERTRHHVKLVDFGFRRKNWKRYMHQRIQEENPDVLGITVATPNQYAVKEIIDELRRYGLPIIGGGTHVSLCPRETIEHLGFDIAVVGDGEQSIAEVLDCLEEGRPLDDVQGIWWRKDGEAVQNLARPTIRNLDSLPSAHWELWEDLDLHFQAYGFLSFNGMRGCPYNCTYCSAQALREAIPGNFRLNGPRLYAQEVRRQFDLYKHRGMRVAWFWDQVFTVSLKWLREFSDEYIKLGLHKELPYAVYARGDEIDEERARLLHDSGCIAVRVGFENGDEKLRYDVYDKKIPTDDYRRSVARCKKYGIAVTGYFILGGPGDTLETMQKTYDLARELDIETPTFYVYKPLPKTKAFDMIAEAGGQIRNVWDHQVLDIRFGAMIDYPHLKAEQVVRFHWKCILAFVPRIIFRQIFHFKLSYFTRLIKYAWKFKPLGFSWIDLYRNFTYVCNVEMARAKWEKRFNNTPTPGVQPQHQTVVAPVR